MEDLLKMRSKQQLVQITNTMSKSILVRYGQSIRVDAQGSIRVPLHYQLEYMQIKFTGKEENSYVRFQVDIVDTNSSAVLDFRLGRKQVHVCPFEAEEWLRQRSGTSQTNPKVEKQAPAFFVKNQTLCVRSLQVLAKQIPVQQVKELAIELGLTNNEVEHLKACGFRGMELCLEILLKWRHKCHKEADDMVRELATTLNALSLKDLASILLKASKGQKCLKTEYFAP
ncbi:hypothetical protein ACJMK2_018137 [Sinanodonta woodiana]|uniref:Death domain-containing protein n=1 Tax=Sinanodonta woodiana TaxID=1069815 RepID=A0ABD3UE27_SINWO